MQIILTILFLSSVLSSPNIVPNFQEVNNAGVLLVYWCGFSEGFCGQSYSDDVTVQATHIIMAFANINGDGSVAFDDSSQATYIPLIQKWQSRGQKVIFSVGGQNANWPNAFKSEQNFQNFAASIPSILKKYNLDGVDLDIEQYVVLPIKVADLINLVRAKIDNVFPGVRKLMTISPDCLGVYQVYKPTERAEQFNYWVPILQRAIDALDFVQPQAYGTAYPGQIAGSSNYIVNVYLNWLNVQSLVGPPIQGFKGVPLQKLVLGLPGAPQAADSQYYITPEVLQQAADYINNRLGTKIGGIMVWSSHWDQIQQFVITRKAKSIVQ